MGDSKSYNLNRSKNNVGIGVEFISENLTCYVNSVYVCVQTIAVQKNRDINDWENFMFLSALN